MSNEQWLPIPGYEGYYEVSDQGRVRSLARVIERSHGRPLPVRRRILRQALRNGYPLVSLAKDGIVGKFYVHRLVLTAFHGQPAVGAEVCHGNDIRTDNRLENLRWDTHKANVGDAVTRGRHRNPIATANANRTRCSRGHAFDTANTIIRPGGRGCRECVRINERERYLRNKELGIVLKSNGSQTECQRGHKFTKANTYVRPNGKRNCIRCRKMIYEAWHEKRKANS